MQMPSNYSHIFAFIVPLVFIDGDPKQFYPLKDILGKVFSFSNLIQ